MEVSSRLYIKLVYSLTLADLNIGGGGGEKVK